MKTQSTFRWIGDHLGRVLATVAIITVAAVPFASMRIDAEEPNFDPTGELYDIQALSDATFVSDSSVVTVPVVVEARDGGDALSRDVLIEWKTNSDKVRSDPAFAEHLATEFAFDLDVEVSGIYSVADAVDAELPDGLVNATEAEVKQALLDVLGDGAVGPPLRTTLALGAAATTQPVAGEALAVWESPAFMARVLVNDASFDGVVNDFSNLDEDAQEFMRDVQSALKGDEASYTAWGVGFDGSLTFDEQLTNASPFILFAIVGVLLLVGALLRSYWAAAVVAVGLGVTMLWYGALLEMLGFKGGMLLGFVAPIATISFGVDFFVHASGRAREEQLAGATRRAAYTRGLGAVFPALLLAVVSSIAAFISNSVAGIEAIVQFGLGSALALFLAFAVLGIVAPKALLAVEDGLGDPPLDRGRMILHKLGFTVMAIAAGTMVTMSIVMPPAGGVLLIVFLGLFLAIPYRVTQGSYGKAAADGRPTGVEIKGAGHGFKAAGDVVHFLARWRVFTLPVTVALAVLGVVGFTQVESEFSFSDFFNSDSGFIQGMDAQERNFGAGGGTEDGYIYIEGDLTQPSVLLAIGQAEADVAAADAADDSGFLSRNVDGALETGDSAVTIVRTATGSAAAIDAIASVTGVTITDTDGDGLADTPQQIRAIYDVAFAHGILNASGDLAFQAEAIPEIIRAKGDGSHATRLLVGIASLTDDEIITDARSALEAAAAGLESGPAGSDLERIAVSGETITSKDSLDAFTSAMVVALPVALLLCALIASVFMRSIRYGVASVVPILLVVGWVYGFMYIADYKINVVTATIAAIAVGVGIDFSTHFTMRFREEFEDEPSRFPALRRAGEGTGGALAISALSSIIGFSVMALAPMPIFAVFGTLTAVMIVFSLLVSLMVLPSLLLVVTRSRTGDERESLLDLVGLGSEYDPHSRSTATRSAAEAHV